MTEKTVAPKKENAYFFVRSYNDLDCRIPLMLNFVKNNYNVKVVGIPLNIGYNHPERYELADFMHKAQIEFAPFFKFSNTPFYIRLIYSIHKLSSKLFLNTKRETILEKIKWALFKGSNLILMFLLYFTKNWIKNVARQINNSILIFDEIAVQPGRSYVVDEIIENKKRNNNTIYAFQTGQNSYTKLWQESDIKLASSNSPKRVDKYIVPGPNDKEILSRQFPNEEMVIGGNTRFDKDWVGILSQMVPETIENHERKPIEGKINIVFMLSKIEYGVDLENIVNSINICCEIEDAAVIIKPHTRGMNLNSFRNRLNKKAFDGTDFSSTHLINWSDIVLFTGSSIILQAMILNKKVIHLNHCLNYNTIFDSSGAVHIAKTVQDVKDIITNPDVQDCEKQNINQFLKKHTYNGSKSGLVCEQIRNQIEEWEALS